MMQEQQCGQQYNLSQLNSSDEVEWNLIQAKQSCTCNYNNWYKSSYICVIAWCYWDDSASSKYFLSHAVITGGTPYFHRKK